MGEPTSGTWHDPILVNEDGEPVDAVSQPGSASYSLSEGSDGPGLGVDDLDAPGAATGSELEPVEEKRTRVSATRYGGSKLSAAQNIAAASLASGTSDEQAAEAAGSTAGQVRKWKKTADFNGEVARLNRAIVTRQMRLGSRAIGIAVQTLVNTMTDPTATHRDRTTAANVILSKTKGFFDDEHRDLVPPEAMEEARRQAAPAVDEVTLLQVYMLQAEVERSLAHLPSSDDGYAPRALAALPEDDEDDEPDPDEPTLVNDRTIRGTVVDEEPRLRTDPPAASSAPGRTMGIGNPYVARSW